MMRRDKILSFLKTDPALMLGLGCSVFYYVIMFQPAMQHTVLAHYTTEHAVESRFRESCWRRVINGCQRERVASPPPERANYWTKSFRTPLGCWHRAPDGGLSML
jgi:hypothetical protein